MRFVCFALALLVCLPAVFAADPRPDATPPEQRAEMEPAALAWLQANAVPFSVDVATPTELKPLMDKLKGARVIGLGEATHGDQQSQLFKTHAIRELVRQGRIDSLMLEVNRRAGMAFDAYVNEGIGDPAQLVVESGLFTIWKTDEFAALALWLRAHVLRTGKPFRVYGIDCQESGLDFADAIDWLRPHDPALADRMSETFAGMIEAEADPLAFWPWLKTQTAEDYARYHGAGLELVAAIEARSELEGNAEALYAARVGVQGLEAFEYDFGPVDTTPADAPPGYFARRDVSMAANLLTRLGDGRAALWAHDMHTAGQLPAIAVLAGYKTVGSEVRTTLGEDYVSVGFAWTEGAFRARLFTTDSTIVDAQQRDFEVFQLACNRPGDLGEFLSRVGPERFYVDFRKADEPTRKWGELFYYRGWCGWGVDPETWLTSPMEDAAPTLPMHDILVYTRRIGPSTLWQLPKMTTD